MVRLVLTERLFTVLWIGLQFKRVNQTLLIIQKRVKGKSVSALETRHWCHWSVRKAKVGLSFVVRDRSHGTRHRTSQTVMCLSITRVLLECETRASRCGVCIQRPSIWCCCCWSGDHTLSRRGLGGVGVKGWLILGFLQAEGKPAVEDMGGLPEVLHAELQELEPRMGLGSSWRATLNPRNTAESHMWTTQRPQQSCSS